MSPYSPRAGLGEWPAWGEQPPELWFGYAAPLPAPPPSPPLPPPVLHQALPRPRLALLGLILGAVGAGLFWLPVAGLAAGLFGAVLSLQALRSVPRRDPRRTLPLVGLVLGAAGAAVCVLPSAILVTVLLSELLRALEPS